MHDCPRVSGGAGWEDAALTLIDVYAGYSGWTALFDLLREREPHQSISHKAMPTWEEHCEFISSRPYGAWYLIEDGGLARGACYLSKQREIGIGIFKACRGRGYGRAAVLALMEKHPGRFLSNINPANEASLKLFRGLGFGGPIQITLEKPE